MLIISETTVVFIFCSAHAVTGGPEALHQLCDKINCNGGEARMVYIDYGTEKVLVNAKTPIRYRHYNIKVSPVVADDKNNVLVIPELWPHLLNNYQQIQKSIWWLSVNYGTEKFKLSFSDQRINHLYQSWYARDFLISNSAENIFPLFDYLSVGSNNTYAGKERIVLYNPKKGLDTTLKIIEHCAGNNIEFKALQGFSRPDMIKVMRRSMLYIDFGDHPGKDRIPREAALYNNAIITSRSGSAAFFEDIPIAGKYKVISNELDTVKEIILFTLNNFDTVKIDFNYYKRVIRNQETEFKLQVVNLFCPERNFRIVSFNSIPAVQKMKKITNDRFEQLTTRLKKKMPASFKSKIKQIGLH